MEVCVIKPSSIEDEIEITETLLNGRTVVINMEGLNVDTAQRLSLIHICILIARKAKDLAGRLICCGMAALVGFQAFINMCVATGLMPNTGIPPVSYTHLIKRKIFKD